MNITSVTSTKNFCVINSSDYYYTERERSVKYHSWDQIPLGYTGSVSINPNYIHYVSNFGRKKAPIFYFHRFDGPASIWTVNKTTCIRYFICGQIIDYEEFLTINKAYKTNDKEELDNTIGMVLASKEYAKKSHKESQ